MKTMQRLFPLVAVAALLALLINIFQFYDYTSRMADLRKMMPVEIFQATIFLKDKGLVWLVPPTRMTDQECDRAKAHILRMYPVQQWGETPMVQCLGIESALSFGYMAEFKPRLSGSVPGDSQ